jgi:hypothetical protein
LRKQEPEHRPNHNFRKLTGPERNYLGAKMELNKSLGGFYKIIGVVI